MRIKWEGFPELEGALIKKSETDFERVVGKNLIEMRERGVSSRNPVRGGTPVGQYKGGGELRKSMSVDLNSHTVGYTKDYAPHVEYGHRQNVGQFVKALGKRLVKPYVPGQYLLKNNLRIQGPKYEKDLQEALKDDK